MLTPFNVEGWQGLRLDADPEEVGLTAAVDLLNVEVREGMLRSRDGIARVGTITHTGEITAASVHSSSQIIYGAATDTYVIDTSGTSVATESSVNAKRSFARIGTTSGTYTYFAREQGGQVKRWDGTSFSSPASLSTYEPMALCVQQPDNRLVMAGLATTNKSRVQFSNPGAPETVTANDYIDLMPGDGELVIDAVAFGNLVFVFKSSHCFVFYGNGTDNTGNTVFNYRTYDLPTVAGGTRITDTGRAVAGERGVYVLRPTGLYRSTGGPFERLSQPIEPVFTDETSVDHPFYQGDDLSTFTGSNATLFASRGLIFIPNGPETLVFDERAGSWNRWQCNATRMSMFLTVGPRTWVGYNHAASDWRLGKFDRDATSDGSVAITSRYRSGFSDLGLPGREKTVRQTELVGQGTVSLGWAKDLGAITSTSTENVTLGTAPASARGMHQLAQNGELLGYQVGSVSGGAWQVNRITPMARRPRDAGAKSA